MPESELLTPEDYFSDSELTQLIASFISSRVLRTSEKPTVAQVADFIEAVMTIATQYTAITVAASGDCLIDWTKSDGFEYAISDEVTQKTIHQVRNRMVARQILA